jgi:ATP-binding cassette, subfamily B, bacterial
MDTLNLLRRTALQVKPYWPGLAGVSLLSLMATPLTLLLPLPLKIVVDSVIGHHPLPGFLAAVVPKALTSQDAVLGLAVAILVAVNLLNLMLTLATTVLREYVGEKMVLDFRSRLFEHVQQLSLVFHDVQGVTHSTYRIQWDAPAVRWLTLDGMLPLATATITFAAIFVVAASINLKLAFIALLMSPILVALTHLYSPRLLQRWRDVHALENSAFGVLQEALGAIRVVTAFGQERRERERYVRCSVGGLMARLRATWMESSLNLLLAFTVALGTAVVLYAGARDIQAGALTVGELLLIMAYLSQLYGPLQTIGMQIASQQRSVASLERAFQLLDHSPAVLDRPGARPIARASGAIMFRKVSFAYGDGNPVLHDLSFEVRPGARVGVAGATGAGKTTLLSLLIRWYDPSCGQILLDGVDLRDYKLGDLRNQFAIVLQEPVLFPTTIAENIAYGRPEATSGEIVAAARAANAHEFITAMPDGYDTLVGERGMRLSGGERQRISLARAFLKDAPILILDEPTSSVDVKTEAIIIQALDRLMEGRTTFMIAHRLSTLASCDLLFRIDNGRLTGATHEVAAAIDDLSRSASLRGSADAL